MLEIQITVKQEMILHGSFKNIKLISQKLFQRFCVRIVFSKDQLRLSTSHF